MAVTRCGGLFCFVLHYVTMNTCVECGKPGTLRSHPECKRSRKNRAERERKDRLKAEGVSASDLSYRPGAAKKAGLSLGMFDTIGRAPCDVCGEMATEQRRHNSPYIRKDTGAVTGTICQKCASALGYLGHDPERLRAAILLMTTDNDLRDLT